MKSNAIKLGIPQVCNKLVAMVTAVSHLKTLYQMIFILHHMKHMNVYDMQTR